jgi:hypothetical protein
MGYEPNLGIVMPTVFPEIPELESRRRIESNAQI